MAMDYFEISEQFHHQRYGCVPDFFAIIGLRIWLWFFHDIVILFDYAHVDFYRIGFRVRMSEIHGFEVGNFCYGRRCWIVRRTFLLLISAITTLRIWFRVVHELVR